MGMEARVVLDVLAIFDAASIDVWVEGGWGIDALLGSQHRDHGRPGPPGPARRRRLIPAGGPAHRVLERPTQPGNLPDVLTDMGLWRSW